MSIKEIPSRLLVSLDPEKLNNIKNQTMNIKRDALFKNGNAYQYIKNPTNEDNLFAVKQFINRMNIISENEKYLDVIVNETIKIEEQFISNKKSYSNLEPLLIAVIEKISDIPKNLVLSSELLDIYKKIEKTINNNNKKFSNFQFDENDINIVSDVYLLMTLIYNEEGILKMLRNDVLESIKGIKNPSEEIQLYVIMNLSREEDSIEMVNYYRKINNPKLRDLNEKYFEDETENFTKTYRK